MKVQQLTVRGRDIIGKGAIMTQLLCLVEIVRRTFSILLGSASFFRKCAAVHGNMLLHYPADYAKKWLVCDEAEQLTGGETIGGSA